MKTGFLPKIKEYEFLRKQWVRMFSGDEARANSHLGRFHKILEAYAEPQRKYHTIQHLIDLFTKIEEMGIRFENPARAIAFIFYHDVVYQTASMADAAQNEERSAQWAEADLTAMGFERGMVLSTADLIRASKPHVVAPGDTDGALLMDADMSILGAPRVVYRVYAGQIREEYRVLADEDFFKGRLEKFLVPTLEGSVYGGIRIFKTPEFRHMEDMARTNIREEMGATIRKLNPADVMHYAIK